MWTGRKEFWERWETEEKAKPAHAHRSKQTTVRNDKWTTITTEEKNEKKGRTERKTE